MFLKGLNPFSLIKSSPFGAVATPQLPAISISYLLFLPLVDVRIPARVLGVPHGAQEMVVNSHGYCFAARGTVGLFFRNIGRCTFCLYLILMKPQAPQSRKTVAVVTSIFALISAYLFYKQKRVALPIAASSATIFVLGMLSLSFANAFHKAWFKLGHLLGAINSRIILSIVYFLFLVPLAYLRRMGSSVSMKHRPTGSNFKTRNHLYTAKDLLKPW